MLYVLLILALGIAFTGWTLKNPVRGSLIICATIGGGYLLSQQSAESPDGLPFMFMAGSILGLLVSSFILTRSISITGKLVGALYLTAGALASAALHSGWYFLAGILLWMFVYDVETFAMGFILSVQTSFIAPILFLVGSSESLVSGTNAHLASKGSGRTLATAATGQSSLIEFFIIQLAVISFFVFPTFVLKPIGRLWTPTLSREFKFGLSRGTTLATLIFWGFNLAAATVIYIFQIQKYGLLSLPGVFGTLVLWPCCFYVLVYEFKITAANWGLPKRQTFWKALSNQLGL